MQRVSFFASLALLAGAAAHAAPPQASGDGVHRPRVLVVSGANNHAFEWTTPSLAAILERSGLFEVEITYDPAQRFVADPPLSSFSALVLDYNGPRWGEAAEARFLDAVAAHHVGVVVVHAADNAFPGWVEYEEIVGDLWREGTGHGSFHPFDVEIVDRDHPITATLPAIVKHPDELYHRLVNPHGVPRRVLATAFSDPATGGTGADEPMVIVKEWRGGRVFHTPLGHVWRNSPATEASHRDPQFRALIVRGTEWAATGAVADELSLPISAAEARAGWRSLMDRAAWRTRDPASSGEGWRRIGDCLVTLGGSGSDLVTVERFEDFELELEWKTGIAGNSGVKYRVPPGSGAIVAPEYQILDASADAEPKHRTGSLYDVVASEGPAPAPFGSFNRSRIVARGGHVEHWLNGVRCISAEIGSAEFAALRAASKFAAVEGFGAPAAGHIALQDHGDEVWFRSIRVRDLRALHERAEAILPEEDLAGWTRVGDATFRREDDSLVGAAGPRQQQSFLVSERTFGDFVLEIDVKVDVAGNSGIQVRSGVEGGRVVGYQIEVDTSERSWSGGLYDENRRGWLAGLAEDAAARAAFRREGWNRYRIECIGPRIRASVNGVTTADHLDAADLSGRIALQVHGGDPDVSLRWRDARIVDLGAHAFAPHTDFVLAGDVLVPGLAHWLTDLGDAAGLRADVAAPSATLVVGERSFELADADGWRADAPNRVTVLRAGRRFAVQLGNATVASFESGPSSGPSGGAWSPVALSVPEASLAGVTGWESLRPRP